MSTAAGRSGAVLVLTLAFMNGAPGRGGAQVTPPPQGRIGPEYLNNVKAAAQGLKESLYGLADAAIDQQFGRDGPGLYRQVETVLIDLTTFQKLLTEKASRTQRYQSYTQVERQLNKLLSDVAMLGPTERLMHRAGARVRTANDELHFALSEGDVTESRLKEVLARQAGELLAASIGLDRAARHALVNPPPPPGLMPALKKLVAAATAFDRRVASKTDLERLKLAFGDANVAWGQVVGGLNALMPGQNVYLMSTAVRVDHAVARLFRLLALKGERPRLRTGL